MSRNTTVVKQEKKASILPQNRNIIDYVKSEMRDFDALDFSPVDSLVLSQTVYMNLGCAAPGMDWAGQGERIADLYRADLFAPLLSGIRASQNNRELLFALCASPRFREVRVNWFVDATDEQAEKQFCAATFALPDGRHYIAFRGTDATVVGWKEDLNMAFMNEVPSQSAARAYLAQIAARTKGALLAGGHSKGGNLAVYAAAFAGPEVQDRIQWVFSHDGPGFREEVFTSPEFRRIAPKIRKTLPQSSLVGMLLENDDGYEVVRSDKSGIMQHDPFSWIIEGSKFGYTEKIAAGASSRNRTIREWLSRQSDEKLQLFVDTVFEVIQAAEVKKVGDLPLGALREADRIYDAIRDIDEPTARCISDLVKQLVVIWLRSVFGIDPEKEGSPVG